MARDESPDTRSSDEPGRKEREDEFSRRHLLRAGSAVPLMGAAGFLAACGSDHGDAHGDHTDAPHNDANHTDTHSDGSSHSDHGHSDTGGKHNDTGHNDNAHNDNGKPQGHNDHSDKNTHGDRVIHDDAGAQHHVDGGVEHTDVRHFDGGQEHTDTFHQDSTVHVDNP